MIDRFEAGKRYRHENSLDVDIQIVAVKYHDAKIWKLRVQYLNRNWVDPKHMSFGGLPVIWTENRTYKHSTYDAGNNVEIRTEDFGAWSRVD